MLGPPPSQQHQHLDLTGGQPARLADLAADAMPGGVQHRPDRVAVEATGSHLCGSIVTCMVQVRARPGGSPARSQASETESANELEGSPAM